VESAEGVADLEGLFAEPRRPIRLAVLGRYLLIVCGAIVFSALTGLLVTLPMDKVYGAESDVLFELDENLEAGFLREDRRLTTQVVTITSRAILDPAADELGTTAENLGEVIEVGVIDGSEIIRMRARGPDEDTAVARLQAVVDSYFAWLEETDSSAEALAIIDSELTALEQDESQLEDRISRLARGGSDLASDPQVAVLVSELNGVRESQRDLEAQRSDLELDDLIQPRFTILTPPYPLDGPLEPKLLQAAVIGALIGAIVGGAVVFIMEQRNPRLR
jgi:uncharacterized protein involved in exopolysaccharide biosynthesis